MARMVQVGRLLAYVYQLHGNGTNVTVQCETNLLQAEIIWYIGSNRFVADTYGKDGSSVTANTTVLVTESITVTCIGRNRSASENDSVTLHPLEAPTDSTLTVATNGNDNGLPTASETAGTTITDSSSQPTFKPPDSTAITVPVVLIAVVLIVLCMVIVLLCYRHRKRTKMKQTANTQRETEEEGRRPSTGVTCSQDAVTREQAENGVFEPEREPLSTGNIRTALSHKPISHPPPDEEREEEKEEVILPSAGDPTGEPSTSPNPLPRRNLLSDEEKEVTVLAAADPTPSVDDLHSSSKPEPFPRAQRAPLDLVKKDEESSKIVQTGQDSPKENDGVDPDGIMPATKELPGCLKTPPQVHSLPLVDTPDDIVIDSLTENGDPPPPVIEPPTSSKPLHHVQRLPPEEKKEEEASKILDTETDFSTENGNPPPPVVELPTSSKPRHHVQCLPPEEKKEEEASKILDTGTDFSTENGNPPPPVVELPTSSKPRHHVQCLPPEEKKEEEASKILDTEMDFSTENDTLSEESTLFKEGRSGPEDPQNSALVGPQRPRRPTSFGLSLKRTLEGNDKNSYKSPDQSPFSQLGEGSHVLGPQFNNAHSRQDNSSLQTGDPPPPVVELPTSSKPPHHVQCLPPEEKKQEETSKILDTETDFSTENGDPPPPVVELPTSSKPPHHVQCLPPEEKKQEETSKILDTETDFSTENDHISVNMKERQGP